MASKFFRCYNCNDPKGVPGRDFVADAAKPTCPKCTLDGTPGSLHANLIVPLRTLHYDPRHGVVKSRGRNTPVCGAPRLPTTAMTGDPNAVNCLACQATEVFKAEKAEFNAGADEFEQPGDFQLTVDPATAAYVKTGE
jgi:hypothetical protein